VGDGSASALWFGATGFEVLEVGFDGIELRVDVETNARVGGVHELRHACGAQGPPVGDLA
jgi:hypothetical protein